MSFQIKAYDTIVQDMVAWIVANSPQITDLTPGSIIRSFCEGAGLCLEELYVAIYLGFRRYLDNIQETVFDFERKAGTKAAVSLIFSRAGDSGDTAIPLGTECKTASGLSFLTTAAGQIDDGETDSAAIAAEADAVGVIYNVAGASITVMVDTIDDVDSVNNPNAATGGVDQETNYQFKQRFQSYIEGLGKANIAGLITGALSVEGITSASVVEYFPPVANVNVRIYVDDGSAGGTSDALVTSVQSIIDGDGTESNPGYRAAGVNVVVAKPTTVTQNVEMTVTASSGADTDQMETDINTALTDYINSLGVGADIIYAELIAAVMGVFGVSDVSITTPTENTTISDTQVGRLGTLTITLA